MPHGTPVVLRPITVENWHACASLLVADGQEGFLPPNVYSIAAAQFYPDSVCRAVYAGQQLVGFVMYGVEQGSGRVKVFRLMVDASCQRRGHGRAALTLVIGELTARWNPADVYVCFQGDNVAARTLYEQAGFVVIERAGNKVTARKPLASAKSPATPMSGRAT